jgi:uncharacterized protein (UPF0262 family)
MSIPIKFTSQDKALKALYDKIDSCDPSDLEAIDRLRREIQNHLGEVYTGQKGEMNKMVEYIQGQLTKKIT